MRYRLDYVSSFTAYEVGTYDTVLQAEHDARIRFDTDWILLTEDEDGVRRMTLSLDDNVVLELHRIEGI